MTAENPRFKDPQPSTSSNNNAALRGASLAFGRPIVKPKPAIENNFSGNNGALAAATKANARPASTRQTSSNRLDGEEQRLGYQRTGSSTASGYAHDLGVVQERLSKLDHGGNGYLQLPSPSLEKALSPSFIAATIAASRSVSVTPNATGQQTTTPNKTSSSTRPSPGRSPGSVRSVSSRGSESQVLDTTPIPSTTSLIGMFEQSTTAREERNPAVQKASQVQPNVRSRSFEHKAIKSPKSFERQASKPPSTHPVSVAGSQVGMNTAPRPARDQSIPRSKPIPVPVEPQPPPFHCEGDYASSDDSFVSVSDNRPSWRAELHDQNRQRAAKSSKSHETDAVDSLANAIVASALASSRAVSPSRSLHVPPQPPPARRSPHKHFFHSHKESSRTPSPSKQTHGMLKTTLRKQKTGERVDEGEARRKKKAHLMKKHPNKHHEGDRKRWRDEVTERERKRYEAVWASNKGLYTSPGFESCVCNLVVRDIFSRSRLHTDVLEEAYSLVDRKHNGHLDREEFVVGLWLLDQRLKGRKLPIRVSESVWRSVAWMGGIKIKDWKPGK